MCRSVPKLWLESNIRSFVFNALSSHACCDGDKIFGGGQLLKVFMTLIKVWGHRKSAHEKVHDTCVLLFLSLYLFNYFIETVDLVLVFS